MEAGTVVKIIHDFKSDIEGEMSLQVGDVVQVLEQTDRHWLKGTVNGREGTFPSGFAIELKTPKIQAGQELFAASSDFVAQEDGDLTFKKGDLIVGLNPLDCNWWEGVCEGNKGIFPVTHVWKLDSQSLRASMFPKKVSLSAKVKMDLKAQLPEELDLRKGDLVSVVEMVDKDWFRCILNGKTGIAPSAFLTILETNQPTENNNNIETNIPATIQQPPQQQTPDSPEVKDTTDSHFGYDCLNSGILPYGRTLTSFVGEYPNELSFLPGQLIRLIRHVDSYWMEGEVDGKTGLFPKKCMEVIVDCKKSELDAKMEKSGDGLDEIVLPPDTYGRCLYSFGAEMEGDLALREGETVTLLRQFGGSWYEAMSDRGQIGLCPGNYIEVIGSNKATRPPIFGRNWPPLHPERSAVAVRALEQAIGNNVGSLHRSQSLSQSTSQHSTTATSNWLSSLTDDGLGRSRSESAPFIKNTDTLPSRTFFPLSEVHPSSNKGDDFIVADLSDVPRQLKEKEHQVQRYERAKAKLVEAQGISSDSVAISEENRKQLEQYDDEIAKMKKEIDSLQASLKTSEGAEKTNNIAQKEQQRREDAKKEKTMEQRQCVITELLQTEKDYLRDMRICQQVFCKNTQVAKSLGIDIETLFGNLEEVIESASRLLSKLQQSCLNKSAADQQVGESFVELAEELKEVYGHYCRNHDEANSLITKYEGVPKIRSHLNVGVEEMKKKTNCFDLNSVLIKPVQRILKYPLLLNELNKCTSDDHVDKPSLTKAVNLMADVATAINEFKRRKDLVFKYRKDADTSLSTRFSKLTLHSLRKKSSRIGVRLASTLGLGSVTKDEEFEKMQQRFHTVEKVIKIFLKDITAFIAQMQDMYSTLMNLSEDIAEFYQERKMQKEVDQLRSAHRIIFTQYWQDFKECCEKRVTGMLQQLLQMLHGPHNLIQKRYDKLLDYDACLRRLEKNKDTNKQQTLREDEQLTKHTYEALNSQLLDELPKLCSLATEILRDCILHFLHARKVFIGRSAKEMLDLMELPSLSGCHGDILETFKVKHNLVVDTLVQLVVVPKHIFPNIAKTDPKKGSSPNVNRMILGSTGARQQSPQGQGQQAFITAQYPPDKLFRATEAFVASDLLDLTLHRGDVIGAIKTQDPTGNPNRWFVDNGVTKGFVPARYLTKLTGSQSSLPRTLGVPDPTEENRRRSAPTRASVDPLIQRFPSEENRRRSMPMSSSRKDPQPNRYWNIPSINCPSPSLSSDGAPSPERYANVPNEELPNYEFDPYGSSKEHRYETVADVELPRYDTVPEDTAASDQYFYSLYPFGANGPHQLSLAEGQVVLVTHRSDLHGNAEWWFVEDRYGNQGYVPANFLAKYNNVL